MARCIGWRRRGRRLRRRPILRRGSRRAALGRRIEVHAMSSRGTPRDLGVQTRRLLRDPSGQGSHRDDSHVRLQRHARTGDALDAQRKTPRRAAGFCNSDFALTVESYFENSRRVSTEVVPVGGATSLFRRCAGAAAGRLLPPAMFGATGPLRTVVGRISTSTRRFCCLPPSLALLAIGRWSAYPVTASRCGPTFARVSSWPTLIARWAERYQLSLWPAWIVAGLTTRVLSVWPATISS